MATNRWYDAPGRHLDVNDRYRNGGEPKDYLEPHVWDLVDEMNRAASDPRVLANQWHSMHNGEEFDGDNNIEVCA